MILVVAYPHEATVLEQVVGRGGEGEREGERVSAIPLRHLL